MILCDELIGVLDYESSKFVLKFLEDINKRFGIIILIIIYNFVIFKMVDVILKLRLGKFIEFLFNF